MSQAEQSETRSVSRRSFLKAGGATGAVVGISGLGVWGYRQGQDPATYAGCEGLQGAAQRFNRERFSVDKAHYDVVGPTSRANGRTEVIFSRMGFLRRAVKQGLTIEQMDEPWRGFYAARPETFAQDKLILEAQDQIRAEARTQRERFILTQAWSRAMSAVNPRGIGDTPPEESDFSDQAADPLPMKDAQATARLIKQMSYEFGSVLTGIARLNPDWVYAYPFRRRGFPMDEPLKVPAHWAYAIVVGTPMSWDPMFANPNYGTSEDAYSKSRIVAFRLASFIKQLGYAARPHTPGADYDLMVPPILVDAGIGEQGRHGVVVTPELGSNFRPAIVTTNLPLAVDKPIRFGVQAFCRSCKICAEQCPSGAITQGGKTVVRGYRRYAINPSKCLRFWNSNLGNMGCRICVAACPYTRKANWIHRSALQVTAHDPTGLSHRLLTALQKRFYPGPVPQDYYAASLGGKNASYRRPPWWLRTEDFIDTSA